MKTTQWLDCKVLKGMFPDEIVVLISTAEGDRVSLFVSSDCVLLETISLDELNGKEVDAKVRVSLIDHNEQYGLVELPAQPVDGSRVAKVQRQLLSA